MVVRSKMFKGVGGGTFSLGRGRGCWGGWKKARMPALCLSALRLCAFYSYVAPAAAPRAIARSVGVAFIGVVFHF